jgi:hypothetical protein
VFEVPLFPALKRIVVTRNTWTISVPRFHQREVDVSLNGIALMTDEESALCQRAKRLGYKIRHTDSEYALTATDGSGRGCVGGNDIEGIHRWLDRIELGTAA